MTVKQLVGNWFVWMLYFVIILARGDMYRWDWFTWFLLGHFGFTAILCIVNHRIKKLQVAGGNPTTYRAP